MPKHRFGKATCDSASTLLNLAPADRRSAVGEVTNPTSRAPRRSHLHSGRRWASKSSGRAPGSPQAAGATAKAWNLHHCGIRKEHTQAP